KIALYCNFMGFFVQFLAKGSFQIAFKIHNGHFNLSCFNRIFYGNIGQKRSIGTCIYRYMPYMLPGVNLEIYGPKNPPKDPIIRHSFRLVDRFVVRMLFNSDLQNIFLPVLYSGRNIKTKFVECTLMLSYGGSIEHY